MLRNLVTKTAFPCTAGMAGVEYSQSFLQLEHDNRSFPSDFAFSVTESYAGSLRVIQ